MTKVDIERAVGFPALTKITTDDVGSRLRSCRVLLPRTRVQWVGSRELTKSGQVNHLVVIEGRRGGRNRSVDCGRE